MEAVGSEVQERVEGLGRRSRATASTSPTASRCSSSPERLGVGRPVDILVNNAGTIARAAAVDHTETPGTG